jgi:MFS family permease
MTLTTAGTLIGLAIAGSLAWFIGGSLGVGLVAGFLCGASVTGLFLAWQRRVLARHPERLVHSAVAGFLVKLAAVLAGALALRYIDSEAEIADWRSFLVAFAASSVLILIPGTLENMQKLNSSRARREVAS